MKTFSTAFAAALATGEVMTSGAVKIEATEDFLVWGGEGTLTIDADTFLGAGDSGLISVSGSQIGGTEDAISLQISRVDPVTASLIDIPGSRNAPVTTWRLGFDVSGTSLLEAHVFDRGRLDQLADDSTPGGTSTITATVETAARGLGKMTGRRTADADQRTISPTDGSCKRVTMAGQLTLAWGGKPPARVVDALPGTKVPIVLHPGGPFPDVTINL